MIQDLQKQFPGADPEDIKTIFEAGQRAERTRALKWMEYYSSNPQGVIDAFTTGVMPNIEALEQIHFLPFLDKIGLEEIESILFGITPIDLSCRISLLTGIKDASTILKAVHAYHKAQVQVNRGKKRSVVTRNLVEEFKALM